MRLLLLIQYTVPVIFGLDFYCRNQNNEEVDWFIFYKLGRLQNLTNQNAHLLNGTAFLYMDSRNKNWEFSSTGMESSEQAIGYTLQQYYNNLDDPDVTSVFWNDQLPNSTIWSPESGHSKGLFAFDFTKGFWLTHSIPRFPRNETYEYPSNAHRYGQMGICVSLDISYLPYIAQQLFYIRPYIYSAKVPTSIAQQIPVLSSVLSGDYKKDEPSTSILKLRSRGGQIFHHYAKAGSFGKDLYFDLVAKELQVSLKTETWQHSQKTSPNLLSWCKPPNQYQVFNVKKIELPFDVSFNNYDDHSKFAVSVDVHGGKNKAWVCIGDINRQEHQLVRGGGTLCFQDESVYNIYYQLAAEYYPCKDGD